MQEQHSTFYRMTVIEKLNTQIALLTAQRELWLYLVGIGTRRNTADKIIEGNYFDSTSGEGYLLTKNTYGFEPNEVNEINARLTVIRSLLGLPVKDQYRTHLIELANGAIVEVELVDENRAQLQDAIEAIEANSDVARMMYTLAQFGFQCGRGANHIWVKWTLSGKRLALITNLPQDN